MGRGKFLSSTYMSTVSDVFSKLFVKIKLIWFKFNHIMIIRFFSDDDPYGPVQIY